MGSIVRRLSGGWQAKVRLKGESPQFRTFAGRAEAKRSIAEVETAMRSGALRRDRSAGLKLGQAIDEWAADGAGRLAHFETEQNRINRLKTLQIDTGTVASGEMLRSRITEIALARLDVDHIESLIDHMDEAGYAPRTILPYLSIIQRAWAHGMRRLVAECPTAAARNRPGMSGGRDRRLEDGEEDRLLAACDDQFARVVRFALATAARQAEIARLTWQDVDLRHSSVTLRSREPGGRHTQNGEIRSPPFTGDERSARIDTSPDRRRRGLRHVRRGDQAADDPGDETCRNRRVAVR